MPILPSEPDRYPPDLWTGTPPAADAGRRWWCLHTRPRQEKVTARHLRSRGLTFYLPLHEQTGRTPGGRVRRSFPPLFPGYVFLHGDDSARVEALKGNTLVSILQVGDSDALNDDLRQIHQMLASGLPVRPEPTYPIGARVQILDGPLQGLVGTVTRRDGRDEFIAVVRFLGRGVLVELRDWQVGPADASPRG